MAEKVTFMKLKVDLECEKCYKKVKKLLGKYPQIRDQRFDEKENIVLITVVCCSPEKIRDKLCYKGGGSIKSIEILEPPKPKPKVDEPGKKPDAADKPKPEKGGDKPKPEKGGDKPKVDPPKADKPKAEPGKKDGGEKPDKKKDEEKPKGDAPPKKDAGGPGPEKPKDKPAATHMPMQPQLAPPMAVPVGMLYAPAPCFEGMPVGPGYEYGGPVLCYDGYYARPVYDSYGGGRPCYVNRCDQYFSDENPSGCMIM
ncbi:pollen-specific leucine-rich repeat extensin-like protein 1 [Cajanus cajan]|uniref:pollen-specific leucine-rich repeat extensin-like protein 1 n=1 Tax=Cajanus cajan TaxID=3821 RepID=UPI00098DD3B2|nr:pollen-specific leucine-rich repeat extensin-like protein 1 [Cajanus cajan]XP_029128294.1 pollen-specific leucine-rich repeat extensin-like protein 1 [Cajanus cajan]